MPKLEIPKNTWLDDARVDFSQGGFWNGTYMVTLTFSGNSCPGDEFLVQLLMAIGKTRLPKRRIVRLQGLLNPLDRDLEKLVGLLTDYGYQLQVSLRDYPNLAWLPRVSWVIFEAVAPIVPVAFDELHYAPPDVETIPEPTLPGPRAGRTQFLYLKRNGSVSAVTRFVCESALNWQLL